MRKVYLIIVVFLIFLLGITLGGGFNEGASNLFEESKDKFESEITKPDNNYTNVDLVPEEHTVNKIAHRIDDFFDEKLKSIISKIFG